MAVSHEIKSQLAKLLATEDLVVEHKKVETACFNVHTRVLTLPMWEKASNTVYDLLVGHEVGHALYTPDEDWFDEHKIPPQFVNLVEDARIEKLMKRRYAGLSKTFFNGYKELAEQDFFQIEEEDVSLMNLADRANLWFKIGNYIQVPIGRGEEIEIINQIADTETFDDVLVAAERLYKYCKNEIQQQKKVADFDSHGQQGGSQPSSDDEEVGDNDEMFDGVEGGGGESPVGPSSSPDDEPEVETASAFEDKLNELLGYSGSGENVYVEIPELNLETVIAKNSDVHKEIDNSFQSQQKFFDEYVEECGIDTKDLYQNVDLEYKKFKTSAQKEVNYLVKEFECRKSADQYARATTARTGILDCSKLHTYKYNEDLFKKVSVIPGGKNHGLVFVLDWSASMSDYLIDTCKQLFNLVWFCKKVSIPFEVYAFTAEWNKVKFDYENKRYIPVDLTPHYKKKENLLVVDEKFSMMNILTSKVSGKELEYQIKNIWRLACCFDRYTRTHYTYPNPLALSGTPLNEALISLHQILPKFQKENKLQKVQCIVLTDGEANILFRHKDIASTYGKNEYYIGNSYVEPMTTFLRDRKIGTTYQIQGGYTEFTDVLLKNLKDKFSSMNFIGIRILPGSKFNKFVALYHPSYSDEYGKIQNDWKKNKSFIITNSGYDAYIGIASNVLSQETDFEVSENATKTQIKSAFSKSLKTKKLNKKVLGEFISLVA